MYTPLDPRRTPTPKINSFGTDTFFGADLTTDPSNMSPSRSPECPNMIRTTAGKIGKRAGCHTVRVYPMGELRELPDGTIDTLADGSYTQNVGIEKVATTDYDALISDTLVDIVVTTAFSGMVEPTTAIDEETVYTDKDGNVLTEVAYADRTLLTSVGKYATTTDKKLYIVVEKGLYANIGVARTGLGESTLWYKLAAPITGVDMPINGVHILGDKTVVHAGNNYYLDGEIPTLLESAGNDDYSVSNQIDGQLVILDGDYLWTYNGTTFAKMETNAYIPTIVIAGTPAGGGTTLEDRNLIQPLVWYRAEGDGGTQAFQLPDVSIDSTTVVINLLAVDGTFTTLVENTGFTVDRTTGIVTFTVGPPVSPITGEDNVYIKYGKTISGYADKINKATISILYGLNGARDRLFVASGTDNIDYWSQINDPSYFPEYNYGVVGQDASPIMGYSIIGDKLATHKMNAENETNTILREGELLSGLPTFVTVGSYQGAGMIAKHSIGILETEPLYVNANNEICAVTPSDVLGERFSQRRSYYLDKQLKEEDLTDAYAIVWNNFYMMAVDDRIYILDGTQFFTEKNTPFSHRQYASFYWTNIGARVMYIKADGTLCFGTSDGKLKEFYEGTEVTHFNDDGAAITCYVDTYMNKGDNFAYSKDYSYIACRIGAYTSTGVKIWARINGIWEVLRDYTNEANYFDFGAIDFTAFTFNTDTTPHVIGQKIRIHKVDKVQFRFENSVLNQPFEMFEMYSEYSTHGYYRK